VADIVPELAALILSDRNPDAENRLLMFLRWTSVDNPHASYVQAHRAIEIAGQLEPGCTAYVRSAFDELAAEDFWGISPGLWAAVKSVVRPEIAPHG
jgi:hypothetical protein